MVTVTTSTLMTGAGPTTTGAGPTTTAPGSVVTLVGGSSATADIPGAHSDPADFYGLGIGVIVIVVAIALTRVLFRRPGGSANDVEQPR